MNSVCYFDSDIGSFALVIQHIKYIKIKDNMIDVFYDTSSGDSDLNLIFPDSKKAKDCGKILCKQIESYYQAMIPQISGCSCKDK